MKDSISARRRAVTSLGVVFAACLPAGVPLSAARAAPAATTAPKQSDAEAKLRETWRETIAHTPQPQEGCSKASYPDTKWTQTACKAAPNRPYLPKHGHHGYTVGNGNDYSAVVSGLVASVSGSFPTVTGVTRETGYDNRVNTYSIQLNSQFFNTTVCNASGNPSFQGWEQFVYSSSEGIAFMQYWLLDYGSRCPSGGWMAYSGSCYRNSNAVSVPLQVITQLANLKLAGTAVSGGTDTLVFTTASNAYSTTGADSVVNLAKAWNAAEFNIVGDGGGSAAKFNKGSSVTVQIALKDSQTSAPSCVGEDGTTGETNNLNLGSCTTSGGSTPSVKFTESR